MIALPTPRAEWQPTTCPCCMPDSPSLWTPGQVAHIGAVAALIILTTACQANSPSEVESPPYEGTGLQGKAADFRLVNQGGQEVSLADFRGEVVVLTFMDSTCKDVCPLTSVHLRTAYGSLSGSEAASVVFLAVNVNLDANRTADTGAATESWQLNEIPSFHFLTGAEAQLRPVWEAYDIAVYRPREGGELVHTPGVFLIDQRGNKRWYVSTPMDAAGNPLESAPLSELLLRHMRSLLEEQ